MSSLPRAGPPISAGVFAVMRRVNRDFLLRRQPLRVSSISITLTPSAACATATAVGCFSKNARPRPSATAPNPG